MPIIVNFYIVEHYLSTANFRKYENKQTEAGFGQFKNVLLWGAATVQ